MEQVFENNWIVGIACSLIAGLIIAIISVLIKRKRKKQENASSINIDIGKKSTIKGDIKANSIINK